MVPAINIWVYTVVYLSLEENTGEKKNVSFEENYQPTLRI